MKLAAETLYIRGADMRSMFAFSCKCFLAKTLIELAGMVFFMRQQRSGMPLFFMMVNSIKWQQRDCE